MKKFISFNELAAQKKVQSVPMDSSDVRDFNLFMKQAARESKQYCIKGLPDKVITKDAI